MGYYGFDISEYQTDIDWGAIPNNFSFAIIRAGYGVSVTQKDNRFDSHMEGARNAGKHIGVYWFLYALNEEEAVQNAKAFLQVIEPYRKQIDFPVVLDVEGDSIRYMRGQGVEPSRVKISGMIKAFCSEIERAGYYAAVYSDNSFINSYFDSEVLKRYDLWFAYWVNKFDPSYCTRNCGVWQYTNKGNVNGIKGNVDLDYTERDYPAIMKEYGLNGYHNEKPEEIPVPVSNTMIESGTVSETETQIFIVLNKRVKK